MGNKQDKHWKLRALSLAYNKHYTCYILFFLFLDKILFSLKKLKVWNESWDKICIWYTQLGKIIQLHTSHWHYDRHKPSLSNKLYVPTGSVEGIIPTWKSQDKITDALFSFGSSYSPAIVFWHIKTNSQRRKYPLSDQFLTQKPGEARAIGLGCCIPSSLFALDCQLAPQASLLLVFTFWCLRGQPLWILSERLHPLSLSQLIRWALCLYCPPLQIPSLTHHASRRTSMAGLLWLWQKKKAVFSRSSAAWKPLF